MNPEDGTRTENKELIYPIDGVIEYNSNDQFANRKDMLVVLEAVEVETNAS